MSIAGVYTSCSEMDRVDYRYLKNLGFNITVKDEDLIIKPKNKLTPELITAIRKNKQTIIKQFADDVIRLALKGKRPKESYIFKIYSKILSDYLVIATDSEAAKQYLLMDRLKKPDTHFAVYTINEIIDIIKSEPNEETKRNIHKIKKEFGGFIVATITSNKQGGYYGR